MLPESGKQKAQEQQRASSAVKRPYSSSTTGGYGLFEEKKDPYTKLYQAVVAGKWEKVEKYMQNGLDCNYNYANKAHRTLINYIVGESSLGENHLRTLRILLENGADVSIRDNAGNTAFENFLARCDIANSDITQEISTVIMDMLLRNNNERPNIGVH